MNIYTYVVVNEHDEYVSEEHAGKAEAVNDAQSRDEPCAVVELAYVFDDSELIWTPNNEQTWPPTVPVEEG